MGLFSFSAKNVLRLKPNLFSLTFLRQKK